jgi:hypothetical protein
MHSYTLTCALSLSLSHADATLAATFYSTGPSPSEVSSSDIAHRLEQHLTEHYAMHRSLSTAVPTDWSEMKFSRGPLPIIEVSIEKRQQKQLTKSAAESAQ